MGDHHDQVVLDWVKSEVNDTLTQTRQLLETYVESLRFGKEDETRLHFCLNYLRQVYGTLTMVELYGAARLTEEMEALIHALLDGSVTNRDESLAVLIRSTLQVSAYLDPVYRGCRDLPEVAMPTFNDLRTARSERSPKRSLFTSHEDELASAVTGDQLKASPSFSKNPLITLLKKLRQMYQMALVGYIKGLKTEENLTYLLKVSERLTSLFEGTQAGGLWPVVSALIESLLSGGCKNTSMVRNLLRQVNVEISHLIDDGVPAVNRSIPDDLLESLLYYVARSTSEGSLTKTIRAQYCLRDALPDKNTVSLERPALRASSSHSNSKVMLSVIKAVSDELISVKDALDLYVRSPSRDQELVKAQLPVLSQVADIMGVLELDIPQKVIQNQMDILSRMVNTNCYDGTLLMDVAGRLIYTKETLVGMVQGQTPTVSQFSATDAGILSTHQSAIQEARSGLNQAKEAIVDYVASQWDTDCLTAVPETLMKVRDSLAVISLERAAMLVGAASQYIEHEFLSGRSKPVWQGVNALIDALSGVEYYLNRLIDDQQSPCDVILDVVEGSLNRLSHRPATATAGEPAATTLLVDDCIDDELIDVFIKKAQEARETLAEYFHRWQVNRTDLTSLVECQRGFHTLKCNGRMVGAAVVGELAWSIENMLNRVIDHSIEPTDALILLVERVIKRLPSTIAEFAKKRQWLSIDIHSLMSEADCYSHGKTWVPTELAAAAPATTDQRVNKRATGPLDADVNRLDCFRNKAVVHLQNINDFIVEAKERQGRMAISNVLQRSLHTLRNDAEMAGVTPVIDVVEPLENVINTFWTHNIAPDEQVLTLLNCGGLLIQDGLDQLDSNPLSPLAGTNDLLNEIHLLQSELLVDVDTREHAPVARHEPTSEASLSGDKLVTTHSDDRSRIVFNSSIVDYMDHELIALFLDEATDILKNASSDLYHWLEHSDDNSCLQALRRHLHTLTSVARKTGVTAIGDLGHELKCLYEDLCESRLSVSQELLNLLLRTHDTLDEMLGQLRSNNVCRLADDLCVIIREFRGCDAEELSGQDDKSDREPVSFDLPDGQNPAMISIFLEEVNGLLALIEEQVSIWQSDTANMMPAEKLMCALHTLKGGARVVGLVDLSDSSHHVEILVEGLQQKGDVSNAELHELVSGVERLKRVIEGVFFALGQVTGSQSEPVPQASSNDVEPSRNISDVLSFLQPDKRTGSFIKAPAFLHASYISDAAVDVSKRDMVHVPAELLEQLVNFSGEARISRTHLKRQVSHFSDTLQKMHDTIEDLRKQLRRLDVENQSQILSRHKSELADQPELDPLEMDQYAELTQLLRSSIESATDLMNLKDALADQNRDCETLVIQQDSIDTELQEGLMRTRMVPFSRLLPRLRHVVRQVASELGKKVELRVEHAESKMDRSVMERLLAPLEHMLRNAIDHGIENAEDRIRKGKLSSGQIRLVFSREGEDIVLSLSDDGKGLNPDVIRQKAETSGLLLPDVEMSDSDVSRMIIEPGFSTAEKVTHISGRGIGLDVVNSELKQLGGRLNIYSVEGDGATFEIRLPFILYVSRVLMINLGEELYAVPLNTIEGIVRVSPANLRASYESGQFDYAEGAYRLHYLGEMLHKAKSSLEQVTQDVPILLVHSGESRVALQVDGLSASREIVMKSPGPQYANLPEITGATTLGDGRVVVILDLVALALKPWMRAANGNCQTEVER